MPFLGLRLGNEPELGPADIRSLGSLAEELGYGEVWMTEGSGRDSLTQLAAIATATSRIGLGTGILPMFSRTPLITAMSSAGLA
ncbi:MAG: LLM class flavin-dependent oxidoreductase, partial [Chloroflexi bacterium]|nr:LLM class flavin-dependent oxidoreductase [Chloroflexota bacterium]